MDMTEQAGKVLEGRLRELNNCTDTIRGMRKQAFEYKRSMARAEQRYTELLEELKAFGITISRIDFETEGNCSI